jgi:hypothetical protein
MSRGRKRTSDANPFRALSEAATRLDEQYRAELAQVEALQLPAEVKQEFQDELTSVLKEQVRVLRERSREQSALAIETGRAVGDAL